MSTHSIQGVLRSDDLLYPLSENSYFEGADYYYDDVSLTNLNVGQSVTITLESQQFSPYLELRQADTLTTVLAEQTGAGSTQLSFTVESGVNYVLRITSQNLEEVGTYTLTTSTGILNPVLPYQAEALSQQGQYRWYRDRPSGQPITLTYCFMEELPSYYDPNSKGQWDGNGAGNFEPMTQAQRKAVRLSLQAWADVSGITFKEVSGNQSAQLCFGTAEDLIDNTTYGWAYLPGTGAGQWTGDMFLNNTNSTNRNPIPGSLGFSTILHEIGHALGLTHPFDDGATLPKAEQTVQYTVMAYDKHPYLPNRHQPHTPMLYDIAAIQELYGKNSQTGKGNTTYKWKPGEIVIETIYDTSGTDTLKARNQRQDVAINLEPGQFSSIGVFKSKPIRDNVAIAFGVTIERAIGGTGNDTLTGNSVDNELMGGAGADVLTGMAGNDRLTGGSGADTFVFQSDNDGIDTITDFTLGEDRLNVSPLFQQIGYGGTDPFLEGVLLISVQQSNTIVSLDKDGSGGMAAIPLVILENFTAFQALNSAIQFVV